MAILQLELEIDSDVHPELHAMLSMVGKSSARAERLRQLASTGLIWEQLRLPARVNIGVGDEVPASDGVDTPNADLVAEVVRRQSAPRAGAAAGPSPRRGDLPPRSLPILRDAVDGQEIQSSARTAVAKDAAAASGRRSASSPQASRSRKSPDDTATPPLPTGVTASENAGSGPRQASRMPDGESTTPPGSGPVPPSVRTSGTRSRLLRMKEKGLFNNA